MTRPITAIPHRNHPTNHLSSLPLPLPIDLINGEPLLHVANVIGDLGQALVQQFPNLRRLRVDPFTAADQCLDFQASIRMLKYKNNYSGSPLIHHQVLEEEIRISIESGDAEQIHLQGAYEQEHRTHLNGSLHFSFHWGAAE